MSRPRTRAVCAAKWLAIVALPLLSCSKEISARWNDIVKESPAPAQSGPVSPQLAKSAIAPSTPAAQGLAGLPPGLTAAETNTIAVFRKAAHSVVFVTQKRRVVDYFAGRELEVPSGSGSGFVWDKAGHIVTNYHVIEKARSVSVALYDQKTFTAELVGIEPRKDIAVLRIKAPPSALHPIGVPDKPTDLAVGQKAIAIGNPFGLDHTLTVGIVSSLGREVQGIGGVTIRDMIQTDAAINPGNSGGPLLNSSAKIIGMNTLIFSRSGSSAGIGFAVPVATIARVVPQIIKTGKAEQVGIGVRIDPQRRLERRADLPGVAVIDVEPDSPAAQAGIKGLAEGPGGVVFQDIIVGIDDIQIEDYDDLYNALDRFRVGDQVKLRIRRGSQTVTLPIRLVRVQ